MADKHRRIRCRKCGEINTGVMYFCCICGARLQNENADDLAQVYSEGSPLEETQKAESTNDTATLTSITDSLSASGEESAVFAPAGEEPQGTESSPVGEPSASLADEDIDSAFARLLGEGANKSDAPSASGTVGVNEDSEQKDSASIVNSNAPIQDVTVINMSADAVAKTNRFSGKPFIMRVAALSVAIISAILFFVPFISVDSATYNMETHTTSFSPVELIGMSFEGMQRYDEEELARSSEMARFKYISASLSDHLIYSPNSSRTEKLMDEYIKLSISLEMKSQNAGEKFSVVMSMLLWIAYAIISIITIIFGIYELLGAPLVKKDGKSPTITTTVKLLIYNAITLPIYIVFSAHASVAARLGGFFGNRGVHLGFGAWLSVIIALAVFSYPAISVIRRAITDYKDGKSGFITRKTAAVAIAAVAFIATTLPAFTVSFAAYSRAEILEETYYSSALDRPDFTGSDMNALLMGGLSSQETFIESAKALAKDQTIGEDVSASFFNRLLISVGMDIDVFYVFLTILSLLCSLFSALTLRRTMQHVIDENCSGGRSPAVLLTVFAMCYLTLGIVFISVSNSFLTERLSRYVTFGLSAAPIITAACALASAIMIRGQRKSRAKDYDAPDVSFSPYVV